MKKHVSLNRLYRLVWNDALCAVVAVAETAKGRGKGFSGCRAVLARWRARLAAAGWSLAPSLLLPPLLPPIRLLRLGMLCALIGVSPGWAQILPGGRTLTSVSNSGAVHEVRTGTVAGNNAFNSFSTFNLAKDNTANLYLPAGSANPINLVSGSRSAIDGVLNAIKDGRIGGNAYFANPNGFLIGASGVINVGSLSLFTPTAAFVGGFFTSPGNPDVASVATLLGGSAPRNPAATIDVSGQINAIEGIALSAGAISVGGALYSGASFVGSAPDFTDVVNASGLAAANTVVVKEGRIEIVADGDVGLSGSLLAPGGAGVSGGGVELLPGATIAARGHGENSAGGTVNIRAEHSAVTHTGALVDVSAGSSGDGGAIEFSARENVELAGGQFCAETAAGMLGSVLIDPANVTVSANYYAGGAGATQETAASVGNSGNLTLLFQVVANVF